MAGTIARYVASGSTDTFSVPFPYLDKDHTKVWLNGILLPITAYTWPSAGSIRLVAGNPAAGTLMEIRRATPTGPLVTFRPGNLDTTDLNVAILQSLYLSQEAEDLVADLEPRLVEAVQRAEEAAESAQGVAAGRALTYPAPPANAVYDAANRRIGNVADPISDGDAVNRRALLASTASLALGPSSRAFTDEPNNNVYFGENVRPNNDINPDGGALIQGKGNTLVGTEMVYNEGVPAYLQYSTFMGLTAAYQARNLYCCEGFGIRNQYVLTDGQYLATYGTDSGMNLVYARNSAMFGAKSGLNRTIVQNALILGVSAAYCAGTVYDSIIIGNMACGGSLSDPTIAYNVGNAVIIGEYAGTKFKGDTTVLIGNYAGYNTEIIGSRNVGIGRQVLTGLRAGSMNVALGDSSGFGIVDSGQNTHLGADAGALVGAANTTSVGYGATCNNHNQVTLGNGSVTSLRAAVTTITALCDERDKYDIEPLPLGREFIRAAVKSGAIVRYKWDERGGSKHTDIHEPGVISQRLAKLEDDFQARWMGLVDRRNPDRLEGTPQKLLYPVLVATCEIDEEVRTHREIIAKQGELLEKLAATVEAQATEIAALKRG